MKIELTNGQTDWFAERLPHAKASFFGVTVAWNIGLKFSPPHVSLFLPLVL